MSTGRKGRPLGSRNRDKIAVADQARLIQLSERARAITDDAHKLQQEYERLSSVIRELTSVLDGMRQLIEGKGQ